MPLRQVVFRGDAPEYALAEGLVPYESGIVRGDVYVRLGHGHHRIVDHALEERPGPIEFLQ